MQTQTERFLPVVVVGAGHGGETITTEASGSTSSLSGRGVTSPSEPFTSSTTVGAACSGGKLLTWRPLHT